MAWATLSLLRVAVALAVALCAFSAPALAEPTANSCTQCVSPQQIATALCRGCFTNAPQAPGGAAQPARAGAGAAPPPGQSAQAVPRRAVQSSSSVILFYLSEYYPHYGQPRSQCSTLLRAAKEQGSRSVNLVPTSYWMDDRFAAFNASQCYPDNWIPATRVDYFCQRWEWDSPCSPWDAEAIKRMTEGAAACLQEAAKLFEEVVISPHLDDGSKTGHWRNRLLFDPIKKDRYGYSYWDTMLGPLLAGAKAAFTRPGQTLVFGPQGEMGGTVFYAPEAYQRVVDRVRSEWSGPARLEVALMFNHAFVPGAITRGPDPPDKRAGPPSPHGDLQGFGPLLPLGRWPERARIEKALPAARRLLSSVDVLGVSCYPRASAQPRPRELEGCTAKMDEEMAAMGFDLRSWRRGAGKRLIWAEFGLGGGVSRCQDQRASTRAEAGLYPWLDVGYPWSAESDPWAQPELRQYRRDWHAAALSLMADGGGSYPLDGAFMWNIMSLDPQGIHPATTSGGGSFKDDVISEAIRKHNAAVPR
ncbi:MAG: hypothetical protein J3K34DRAFT_159403 [Monoraphidium minutum]|nr:MAG: hypothetical protein J3K34DRAFT_159403 [Monoraphidium minutum]